MKFFKNLFIILLYFIHNSFIISISCNFLSKNLNLFLIVLLISLIFTIFLFKEIPFPKFTFKVKFQEFKLSHILITLLIIFPSILFLNNVSFGDFNWGGDHRDFVLASLVNNEFWLSSIASERDTIENFKN